MKTRNALWICLVTVVASGCTATQMLGSWKSQDYDRPLQKTLVMGIAPSPLVGRIYEGKLVDALRSAGVDAVAATSVLPEDVQLDKDHAKKAIAGQGYDTVFVTRLVKVDKEKRYVPGYTYVRPHPWRYPRPRDANFYDYYTHAYPLVHEPGYTVEDTVASLETSLYDADTGELVWAMSSESIDPDQVNRVAAGLAELIVTQLRKDDLLPPPATQ
jgi:hypothetical protein